MSKKLLMLTVRGNAQEWSFDFYGDPKHLDEWRADGLDIVEVRNTVPVWALNLGIERVWVFLQDLFNFNWWRR